MNAFPQTAEQFYAQRDARTNECTSTGEYQNVAVSVSIEAEKAETLEGQVMLATVTNMLSRWCRNVLVIAPSVTALPILGLGHGDLAEGILHGMQDADPFGSFSISRVRTSVTPLEIVIGNGPVNDEPQVGRVFVDAAGWLAGIDFLRPPHLGRSATPNPLGAIAASCFGVSHLFKLAVGAPRENYQRPGIFDLFHLSWTDADRDDHGFPSGSLGNLLMVGAGAVGSAAVYCLGFLGMDFRMTVVDRDIVDLTNLNRSPIFGRTSVSLPKVLAVEKFLAIRNIEVMPRELWWDDFIRQNRRDSFAYDVWLPLANDFGVRHSIQHNVPPLMIHASTTSNWGTNHGRHIPGIDDCLLDRFPTTEVTNPLLCSTGQLPSTTQTTDAALPFVSLFAGLLVASDLVRSKMDHYPQVPNFALVDWFGDMAHIQVWNRQSRATCSCRHQIPEVQKQFNGDLETAKFSPWADKGLVL